MPNSRLDEIVENKRLEVAARKKLRSTNDLEKDAVRAGGRFLQSLQSGDQNTPRLITEIKPKSPSAGVLKEHLSLDSVLESYNKHAAAISVLTDQKYFGGSLSLLHEVSARSSVPTLCKDFIIDRHQCFEARINGAEAVLLIVKILAAQQLQELHAAIRQLGMIPVVEVQTETELEAATALNPQVILINNRNLTTFEVDLATTEMLAPHVPPSALAVSASGIES
ncbi:MAG TPA: indole-3-glycerol phosphate synthase TrpC, partial [Trichormus sp.]